MKLHEEGEGDLCLFDVFKRGCLVLGFSRGSKHLLRGVMPQSHFLAFSDLNPHMHVYLLWKSEYMSASLRHLPYLCTPCPRFLSYDCSFISWEPGTNKQGTIWTCIQSVLSSSGDWVESTAHGESQMTRKDVRAHDHPCSTFLQPADCLFVHHLCVWMSVQQSAYVNVWLCTRTCAHVCIRVKNYTFSPQK